MNRILSLILVALALVAAGCGGSSPAATQGGGAQQPGRGGFFAGANLAKLAGALGVSQAKLQAALKSVVPARGQRPAGGGQPPYGQPPATGQAPPQGGQRPPGGRRFGAGRGNLAPALAKKLGLPEAKVRAALQKVLPQRGARPPGGTAPS
jgi:hypothetical protein